MEFTYLFAMCIAFTWQGFGSGETAGMDYVEKTPDAALMLAELVLASSKMEMPLAKAKSISHTADTSVKTSKKR